MPLPLYLPRRHRRPLLFPPGLLALAWLLWLGCMALPQMRGMEKPKGVLQLTMPPLDACLNSYAYRIPVITPEGTSSLLTPYSWPNCWPLEKLEGFRSWQTIIFTGNIFADYFSYQQAVKAATSVRLSSVYDKGLRIQFNGHASYSSLIYSVNLLNENNIVTWWLDIQQIPTTLYAFTKKPATTSAQFFCDTQSHITHLPELPVPFSLADFINSDWRNSTLLLLLIGFISAVRLGRRWWLG